MQNSARLLRRYWPFQGVKRGPAKSVLNAIAEWHVRWGQLAGRNLPWRLDPQSFVYILMHVWVDKLDNHSVLWLLEQLQDLQSWALWTGQYLQQGDTVTWTVYGEQWDPPICGPPPGHAAPHTTGLSVTRLPLVFHNTYEVTMAWNCIVRTAFVLV